MLRFKIKLSPQSFREFEVKKIFVAASAAAAVFVLAGCKSGVQVPLNYSDLSGAAAVRTSTLFLEVPSCKDRKTGLESSQLLEAKQRVAYVIKDAKFEKCTKDGFQDIAMFQVPVTIGTDAAASGADLTIQQEKDGSVQFTMSEQARHKLDQITENAYGFDPDDFEITVWMKNNSGSDLKVFVPSAIVKAEGYADTPVHNGRLMQKNDVIFGYTLSNVAARGVLASKGSADAFVIEETSAQ